MHKPKLAALGGALAVLALMSAASCSTMDSDTETRRVIPLAFAGPSSYAALSGIKGKAVVLEPFAEDLAVERISWRRVGILSCFMQVQKRAPENLDRVAIDKSEQCEGAEGDESPVKSVGELNAAFAPTMRVITALRACFPAKGKGLRLAALEVEITELKPDGSISAPQTGKEERFGNGFDDCGQLADWSRCPPGQVGNGVRTHFNKALGSHFIVGLELRCRALVPSRAAQ
ncbi:MAG: hypothetical protein Q8P46_11155 [Hyphomicrobiales bacterium]|nr:hypothetical protein [Hyphomicrobiales bacterium]